MTTCLLRGPTDTQSSRSWARGLPSRDQHDAVAVKLHGRVPQQKMHISPCFRSKCSPGNSRCFQSLPNAHAGIQVAPAVSHASPAQADARHRFNPRARSLEKRSQPRLGVWAQRISIDRGRTWQAVHRAAQKAVHLCKRSTRLFVWRNDPGDTSAVCIAHLAFSLYFVGRVTSRRHLAFGTSASLSLSPGLCTAVASGVSSPVGSSELSVSKFTN